MKHGGDLAEAIARHGGTRAEWLDLSTGINPRPWSMPKLDEALWHRLPSRADEAALLDAARKAYLVPDAVDVVAAPGTQALIQWLPYLAPAGAVAVVGPTYSEHAQAWQNAGREVRPIGDIGELPDEVRHLVIVNPNNPDGRVADQAALARAAKLLAARGGWLVIDEAFADVDPAIGAVDLCARLPVLILRSFGKFYGLAGLRLGFALAAPAIASRIATALGPWVCSAPSLAIGAAALRDHDWAERARDQLRSEAAALEAVLVGAGLQAAGGTSLYRLVRHPDARALHEALARQRIWCRSFDWADDLLRFGLPADEGALKRLAAALAEACEQIDRSIIAI
uniref:threonine-phosphate decarboxylase n=1 Tax=Rhodopseudomonas palustris (strain BisA53) TaxID=316055 RepID=Q07PF2_RHOP5